MRWLAAAVVMSSATVLGAETMRIAMFTDAASVKIESTQLMQGEDIDDGAMTTLNDTNVVVQHEASGDVINGVPLEKPTTRFRSVVPDAALRVNGVRVRGDVVVARAGGKFAVINVLPLEEYLVGVLGSEMPRSFPLEALKAQAVAARTYALNKKLEQYGQPYHLGSSVMSQVYKGLDADDVRVREAVEATRGEVLTYQLQPIEAYFHSSCGGETASGFEALSRDLPYLKATPCPCGDLPTSHWTLEVNARELKVSNAKKEPLKVESMSSTKRVKRVTVGKKGVDAVTLRERLGYMRLKSLKFHVTKTTERGWTIEGTGFGHGAGLCQWGARVWAERGWDYRRILAKYYQQTEILVLY